MNLKSRSCELLWMCGGADGRMPLVWGEGGEWGVWPCARECASGREHRLGGSLGGIDGLFPTKYPGKLELYVRFMKGRRASLVQ